MSTAAAADPKLQEALNLAGQTILALDLTEDELHTKKAALAAAETKIDALTQELANERTKSATLEIEKNKEIELVKVASTKVQQTPERALPVLKNLIHLGVVPDTDEAIKTATGIVQSLGDGGLDLLGQALERVPKPAVSPGFGVRSIAPTEETTKSASAGGRTKVLAHDHDLVARFQHNDDQD